MIPLPFFDLKTVRRINLKPHADAAGAHQPFREDEGGKTTELAGPRLWRPVEPSFLEEALETRLENRSSADTYQWLMPATITDSSGRSTTAPGPVV